MSEMVDRVAKAIDRNLPGANPDAYLAQIARAAIAATREPPEDVLLAGIKTSSGGVLCSWQSMIDEMLK